MYVTRRLSEYQKKPSELKLLPPEGPNSGIMVIQDEESQATCCFGSCYEGRLKGLPFPQNVKLNAAYTSGGGEHQTTHLTPVVFIPVLDQPLSSNLYYVLQRRGKHTGKASASATEEERVSSCFCFSYIPDAKPQEADPYDIYQQFEIHQRRSSSRYYSATSVASDGVPPNYLKRKDWWVSYSTSHDFGLRDDAKGINTKLRLDSELTSLGKSIEIGKWYVPFIFVMEGDVKDQMNKSTFYSVTLQQRWEEVFFCENIGNEHFEVVVDVDVETESVKLEGQETNLREDSGDGVVWFSVLRDEKDDKKIGLGSVVVERMKWEEERFGWLNEAGERSNIKRSERFEGGSSHWKSYRCYVLIESFELTRMDGSLVLTYEFRHVDKLKSKWD
ncbi:hypothetical protein (DUF1262) [Arabidopsis thaliana]|jgi:hypothetical protein|uniref:At1g13480 n=2 Tax=Arabidopsis thaliana TaxID=3702 RepID=Q56Y29_ARATH|nr:hypothetical protein (DUF1262) [Arabidopsis thaliana]AAY56439.1 At1g13480 [Arabidopsis thaliana]AEE29024.1 hypothetical protein (DUF1262) [Arabidopsis thaliana]BAD94696.1 hypothetical protein [Arabidopsis thaliana]CAA0199484.1 unnamed protein product [Arabidopsis thaliana]|eukprot:NP_172805.1 hypothetical protein (DUF1262) [Arabidopsis thaliana]